MSTLRKKVFLAEPVNFFLWSTKYASSLIFGNAGLGEIKGHSLTGACFRKIFLL